MKCVFFIINCYVLVSDYVKCKTLLLGGRHARNLNEFLRYMQAVQTTCSGQVFRACIYLVQLSTLLAFCLYFF